MWIIFALPNIQAITTMDVHFTEVEQGLPALPCLEYRCCSHVSNWVIESGLIPRLTRWRNDIPWKSLRRTGVLHTRNFFQYGDQLQRLAGWQQLRSRSNAGHLEGRANRGGGNALRTSSCETELARHRGPRIDRYPGCTSGDLQGDGERRFQNAAARRGGAH